jgi:hypothetical protein
MSLKFSSNQQFCGQITSEVLLKDNPRLGIGGQVAVERLNLPTHAPHSLYYHGIYIGSDPTQEKS